MFPFLKDPIFSVWDFFFFFCEGALKDHTFSVWDFGFLVFLKGAFTRVSVSCLFCFVLKICSKAQEEKADLGNNN